MATATGVDLDAMKRAIEARDADAQIALYADDAEVVVIDAMNPPSKPMKLSGKEAIADWVRDVTGRDMTHQVENVVADGDRISYSVACQYSTGERVQCMATLTVVDGKVARQDGVQAWDSGD
jgi:ketosteroid isomerase-like protein